MKNMMKVMERKAVELCLNLFWLTVFLMDISVIRLSEFYP